MAARLNRTGLAPIRVVDGTIVKESGKTGSQWRILYSLQLPSLMFDFFQRQSHLSARQAINYNPFLGGIHAKAGKRQSCHSAEIIHAHNVDPEPFDARVFPANELC